jgi:preprotein translocase subunit SecG
MIYSLPMKTIASLLPYIQIGLAVLMIVAILLQQTGAQIGGAFGGSDNFSSAFHTRRGAEKTLFMVTIVIAILFAISALVTLI